jgi:hypothetical protein
MPSANTVCLRDSHKPHFLQTATISRNDSSESEAGKIASAPTPLAIVSGFDSLSWFRNSQTGPIPMALNKSALLRVLVIAVNL